MSRSEGFPFLGLFQLIFVLAKTFEVAPVAGWSWWWVFSPTWIPLGLVALFVTVAALGGIGCRRGRPRR